MFRTLLKSKIPRVAVTHCELHYEATRKPPPMFVDEANRQMGARPHVPAQQL